MKNTNNISLEFNITRKFNGIKEGRFINEKKEFDISLLDNFLKHSFTDKMRDLILYELDKKTNLISYVLLYRYDPKLNGVLIYQIVPEYTINEVNNLKVDYKYHLKEDCQKLSHLRYFIQNAYVRKRFSITQCLFENGIKQQNADINMCIFNINNYQLRSIEQSISDFLQEYFQSFRIKANVASILAKTQNPNIRYTISLD